ncbi:MAG: DUF1538 domain-containing protein [Clostridiales bacterium]|nr:DUF1538 domain-containing protein [Clostridiales bacterium]
MPSRHAFKKKLTDKTKESLSSVLPITMLVLLLSVRLLPVGLDTMGLFLVGALLLIVGMGLFTLGADTAMLPMGTHVGSQIARKKSIVFLVISALLLGILITVAEPDLHVLASQISGESIVLIIVVAGGVGMFLVTSLLRILFSIKLSHLLLIMYGVIFILGIFVPEKTIALCFDSGGVTTGPMTVPFILALGMGVANVRGGKQAQDDSFGLVALCSIGPILAVMIMCIIDPDLTAVIASETAEPEILNTTRDMLDRFVFYLPTYLQEVLVALAPITILFLVFQVLFLRLPLSELKRIGVGLVYTYVGLVLFMVGVNAGFMPMGTEIGRTIAGSSGKWWLLPLGMLMGYLVVKAEPAVHVLNEQVEQITAGAVSRNVMMKTLSIGVAISVGLAMLRVLCGTSIWWFVIPGYAIALGLSFYTDPIFTAVAFDSGGVASGPMTASFMLPLAMGAADALGIDILSGAFGLVALVAMTPLIAIQVLGAVYKLKTRKAATQAVPVPPEEEIEIIDL